MKKQTHRDHYSKVVKVNTKHAHISKQTLQRSQGNNKPHERQRAVHFHYSCSEL